MVKETDLYTPVKRLLEGKGYEVKSEVRDCDVVAVKANSPAIVVELKLMFSIELILQAIDRQNLTDDVYLAVLKPDTPRKRKNWRLRQKGCLKLCRRLGLGLLHVSPESDENPDGDVSVLLDPAPYVPRKNTHKVTRLIKEFEERSGDPNTGGVNKRKIMTAYRQNALKCAILLQPTDGMKLADIRVKTGVSNVSAIMQHNYYGWFERVSRGYYRLSSDGQDYLENNAAIAEAL